MREMNQLISEMTKEKILEIYTEKFRNNFQHFSQQEQQEIQAAIDSKAGIVAGVIIESKELEILAKIQVKLAKQRLYWDSNEARTEYRGTGKTTDGDRALYEIKRNGEQYEVFFHEQKTKRESFLTLTAAQDYCETRYKYLNKRESRRRDPEQETAPKFGIFKQFRKAR